MPLDLQQITVAAAAISSVIGAIGLAAERIITALRRYHGPPDDTPRARRRVRRNVGEDGDG